jgi:ABC-type uncharacterized transport system involved in gliding motility auxiliary subunit
MMLDEMKALSEKNEKYKIYLCFLLMFLVICFSVMIIHFLFKLASRRLNEIIPLFKLLFGNASFII